jgi:putative cell wall-binding protein
LAGALSVVGIALAPPAGAVDDVSGDRIAGTNRYGTAAAIAGQDDFNGATTAILATGETFPDALAASGLAGANGPAPIILTESETYSEETQEALNNHTAVTNVIIVGGTAAISQEVEDAVVADGFTVSRVAGTDRYGTAADIASEIGAGGEVDGLSTAFIATGTNFADALAGGPAAYALSAPILLVTPSEIPAATSEALSSLGIEQVIILGGTAAVSDDVENELESSTGNDAIRVAGTNRFGTAAAVGEWEVENLSWAPTEVLLASGVNFPDALAGGPLGGERSAPIILTASLPEESEAFLDAHSNTITDITALGGTAAIDEETLDAAETAAEEVGNDEGDGSVVGLTDAPELEDVTFGSLTSTGGSAGVGQLLVTAHFDEDVLATPIVQTGFKIYTPYGEAQNSNQAQRNADDPSAVDVVFDVFGSSSFGAIEGTVFTVVANTVQDSDGKVNPEGDLPGFVTQTFAPGITRNPDLTAVAVQTANTVYDFTFDSAVQVLSQTGFRMVDSDGASRTSTVAAVVSGTTPASTVVRVTFPAPVATAVGIRGAALEGAVASTASALITNPTQASDVSGSTGLSDAPDLVAVTMDSTNNTVTFTFDETIDSETTPINRTGFHVYYRGTGGASRDQASSLATDRSASDPRSVVAQFPAGSINEMVAGAYVDDSAVDRAGATAKPNRVDEEGVGSSFEAGAYLGPELVSATSENVADILGNVSGRRVRFLFDETITLTSAASFFVTDSDGNRTNLTGCALDAVPNNNRVTCTVTGSTGVVFTEIGDSELATVASGAVTGTQVRSDALGSNLIANHEERAAAPGPARTTATT